MELLIEGDPQTLHILRREIDDRIGAAAELEPRYDRTVGTLNEPILIALIVALGGKEIILAVRDIINRRYEHLERIEATRYAADLTLTLRDQRGDRVVSVDELIGEARDGQPSADIRP
ncbi:hypothetical protein ACWT_3963 [Actinoplanes sp. SE50]|uniref:hypothetical protein n=1 Tax=unclassified Actinoplanes TaxID=2626549 RepID=UPI00023ED44F|nr:MULTISPECIES: hypothetical protein [unclassified Actinoplanes]AEV84987.1 hypothetical protein ACPL_4092 [Actinoplanes sp. SE50/110]ATO83378.1 hypothetical protein ACWT_3963 [Actinoplanes sp. SE50]SLM00785.1 uncharacterized protein ACSP50_4018 [Actinoplanes sp. SE50/110]